MSYRRFPFLLLLVCAVFAYSEELSVKPLLVFTDGTEIELFPKVTEASKEVVFRYKLIEGARVDVSIAKRSCGCLNVVVKEDEDVRGGSIVSVFNYGEYEGLRNDVIQVRAVSLDGSNRIELYSLSIKQRIPSVAVVTPAIVRWAADDGQPRSVRLETISDEFSVGDISFVGEGFSVIDKALGANNSLAVFKILPTGEPGSVAAFRITIKSRSGDSIRRKTVFLERLGGQTSAK